MTEHLHAVTITGTVDDPEIEFTCHGDRDSECHSYPDCECEVWGNDHAHLFVPHDDCWMRSWFDRAADDPEEYGPIHPMPDQLAEEDCTVGMSGPIRTHFNGEFIEWEFIEQPEVTG